MLNVFKALTLVVLLMAAASGPVTQLSSGYDQNPTDFLVAILRADGTLVPFAQYGNGGFYNPWPRPQPCRGCSDEIYPHSLGGLPHPWFVQGGRMPKRWYRRSPNGTLTVLNALKIVEVENHSQKNWAVRTDFPPESAEGSHDANTGLAITTTNLRIESMVESKPEPDGLPSFINEVFDADETTKIEKLATDDPSITASLFKFGLPESAAKRNQVEVTTKFYRSESPINGEYLYYFEARKEYELPRSSSSGHVSLFSGWASVETREGGQMGLILSEIVFTDTDMKGPTTSRPMGILKLSGRTFIFVEEHGWEDESYVILELNDGIHRLLETLGG
jgi:hypothetical protein